MKVLSPSSPTSQVRHPFLHRDRLTPATPSAEERKGFARSTTTTSTLPSRGRLASSSSGMVDYRQQQQQQSYRSPSPSSPRMVTSPPTPAASTGNTPTTAAREQDASASAPTAPSPSPSAPASRLPLPACVSGQLPTVDEQLRSASSSGRGSGSSGSAVQEGPLQEEQPSVPPPGGALGASASASLASAVDVTIPTGAIETASVGFGGEAGHEFGWPEGDEETGGVVAAGAPRDEDNVGGRGYVGQRFIQAAEVRDGLTEREHTFPFSKFWIPT